MYNCRTFWYLYSSHHLRTYNTVYYDIYLLHDSHDSEPYTRS